MRSNPQLDYYNNSLKQYRCNCIIIFYNTLLIVVGSYPLYSVFIDGWIDEDV